MDLIEAIKDEDLGVVNKIIHTSPLRNLNKIYTDNTGEKYTIYDVACTVDSYYKNKGNATFARKIKNLLRSFDAKTFKELTSPIVATPPRTARPPFHPRTFNGKNRSLKRPMGIFGIDMNNNNAGNGNGNSNGNKNTRRNPFKGIALVKRSKRNNTAFETNPDGL